ncbi:unnamed protein product [Brugia pahangi]|uniref:WD_REPEATS_REGION domain-containing protein n=1 Tax=Brugia pahangi TaxID=6280 RepID=A0A0N4T6A6_BRUPA|nr:unnamed protein product [Brugia pahangi]
MTPTTISIPKITTILPKPETPTTHSRSKLCISKAMHDENTAAKSNQIKESKVVMHARKKRKILTSEPRKCKMSLENNTEITEEINNILTTPASTPSTSILSVANLNESVRYKRTAAAKISSFKEPNLVTKMRNPNKLHVADYCPESPLQLMLEIGVPHVIFQSGSALSEIFYDDVNKKIVTVRGEDVVEVKACGLESDEIISFRLKNRNKIRAIKFSPDQRLICVQYDESTVDFINFTALSTNSLSTCFSQSAKNCSAHIIGLEWILNSQILFITNQGLELYQINQGKKSVKLLKSYNISLYWYLYYPYSQLIIVSSGVAGTLLNPFAVQNGNIHRLVKFEVEFSRSNTKPRLLEREMLCWQKLVMDHCLILAS